MKKVGLILEGGSFRGIFTAGVVDCLLENNISFPYVIGVSAGSGNATSFISRQHGRIRRVITQENARPFYGIRSLVSSGKIMNTDRLTFGYAYKDIPFDFKTFFRSDTECEIVATNCRAGYAEYLSATGTEKRILTLIKASCSLPIICEPVRIGAEDYLDGSLSDSIPIKHVLNKKCEKAVVILTRRWEEDKPTDYKRFRLILRLKYKSRYPKLYDTLMCRKECYKNQMKLLEEYEKQGRAYVIRPNGKHISYFEKDKNKLNDYYQHGKEITEKHLTELRDFMKV